MFEGFSHGNDAGQRTDPQPGARPGPACLLLLHGYPQSHVMWHKVAPRLAAQFTVVAPDLRGYGDSDKPPAPDDHEVYCKRTTSATLVELMNALGHERWHVVGHDRGARVAHRMALDHPERIPASRCLDVVASQAAFDRHGRQHGLRLVSLEPHAPALPAARDPHRQQHEGVLRLPDGTLVRPRAPTPEAYAEYERCFCNEEAVHATCAEYRAVELDLRTTTPIGAATTDCPMLRAVGLRHHQAARLADRQEPRHRADLARPRMTCAGSGSTAGTSLPRASG